MTYSRNSNLRSKARSGVATIELAVVLPVMLIIVLGTIEVCQRLFLRQSATVIAYEAARLAARSTSSSVEVTERGQTLLTQRRVTDGSITITPANLLDQPSGTLIQVKVSIPWASNTPSRFVLKDQGTLEVSVYMLRE